MSNVIDMASAILSQSERRVEVAGQNLANIATPGYKQRVSFADTLAGAHGAERPRADVGTNFTQGKLMQSSNPYDLALSGDGFFVIRTDSGPMYTRQGQFQLDADGRLVTTQGLPVQAQGGGDIALKGRAKDATISIASDGSVLEDGEPIAKLDIVTFDPKAATYAQAGMFTAPDTLVRSVDTPVVRQGMLEASNVSNADEMMTIMEAMRRAQAGQKLANLYDDLMGRALSVFGQS
jgi:flagellar basal-body rod protein FlgF